MTSAALDPEFEALLVYLRDTRGFDLTGYKRSTLTRRVERRMQALEVERYADYIDYLEVHPEEFGLLFDMILINVTEFFRDPPAWDALSSALGPTVEDRGSDEPIRVWSAGCASGEEAYTLAIVLAELLGTEAFKERVKIYGTDVDEDALSTARTGRYGPQQVATVPPELRERYFEPVNGSDQCSFRKDLRRSVIFGRHDLAADSPISRLDLLVCRNALMYFNAEAQTHIIDRFEFGLRPGGLLFLGKAETLLGDNDGFTTLDVGHRIFARSGDGTRARPRLGMVPAGDGSVPTSQLSLREVAFAGGPIAQLVIDADGVLAYANARARTIFRLSAGDVGRPIQDLEVSYRPVELRSLMERARADRRTVDVDDVRWTNPSGGDIDLSMQVAPLLGAHGDPVGTTVSVVDMTRQKELERQLQASSRQLETAYEELQSTNEELETTNEELQSTIEELETTNEELYSTNEELETMNEELQSTNEEILTVNQELGTRSEELRTSNEYMESILTSLRAGVVVVDTDLLVRVWNRWADELWGLHSEEVQGKNFLNLDIGLPVSELQAPLRAAMSGGSGQEALEVDAVNRRGKAIRCRVTISPLGENGTRGALLLMENGLA